MSDENKNIENNQEENQNKSVESKNRLKIFGVSSTKRTVYILIFSFILVFFTIFYIYENNIFKFRHNVFIKGPKMHFYHNGPAVLMNDGNVLVIGGDTKQAEIYDYKKNKFVLTKGKMNYKRQYGASATALKNGNVLITGGGNRIIKKIGNGYEPQNPIIVNKSEIYDGKNQIFIENINMCVPRASHTALEIDNGNILFFGGYDKDKKNVLEIEEYDIDTNKFKIINKFKDKNYLYHSCLKIDNNKVVIIAIPKGYIEKKLNANKIFIYDYDENKIYEYKESKLQVTSRKIYSTNISLHNPYGDDSKNLILRVDYNSKNIIKISVLQNSKSGYTVNNLNENISLLIGGKINDGWGGKVTNETLFYIYNYKKRRPENPKLNKKRCNHLAINLKDNRIIIIGGYSIAQLGNSSVMLTSEIYYK